MMKDKFTDHNSSQPPLKISGVAVLSRGVMILLFLFCAQNASAASLVKPSNNLGLVGYWSFNEGTGTKVLDGSGNGNTLTIGGGATWTNGKLGKAHTFNGSTQYAATAAGATTGGINTISNAFTISFWTKLANNTQPSRYALSKLNNAGTDNVYAVLYGYTSGQYEFYCAGCGVGYSAGNTRIAVADTNWHHITYTYDGTTFKGYLDGVSAITPVTATFSLTASTNQLVFGAFDSSHNFFTGTLDETRIYSRALSAAEVAGLYQAGAEKLLQGASNNGLVGYWSFNEGSSTKAFDYSGNGNTGTLTNMAAPATATSGWNNGKLGKALTFDGTNDYVVAPSTGMQFGQTTPFSISAWIKTTSPGNMSIVSTWQANVASGYRLDVTSLAAGVIDFGLFSVSGTNNRTVYGTRAVNDGRWHHVVGTYSGNSNVTGMKLYVDGASDATNVYLNTDPGTITSPFVWTGSLDGTNYMFNGSIDDVRVYNRELSASEVATLYGAEAKKVNASQNVTASSLDSGLVGLWSFNGPDVNSTTAFDRSGQGNNGTLTNGPTLAQGRVGQGLSFDGVNDYVVSTFTPTSVTDFTVSSWIKETANASIEFPLTNRDASANNGYGFLYENTGSGHTGPEILMANGGSLSRKIWGANLSTGIWHHVVGTHVAGATTLTLYVDGVAGGTTFETAVSNPGNAGAFIFGRDGSATPFYFTGSLDEVRIYNRALSAGEVKQLYNLGR